MSEGDFCSIVLVGLSELTEPPEFDFLFAAATASSNSALALPLVPDL